MRNMTLCACSEPTRLVVLSSQAVVHTSQRLLAETNMWSAEAVQSDVDFRSKALAQGMGTLGRGEQHMCTTSLVRATGMLM